MSDNRIIPTLRAIMGRTGASYSLVAAFAATGPGTVRLCLATGDLPVRQHARDALRRFAEANAEAKTRSELRVP
jgi:hypothetical protein